jgi:hypothetical protein
MGVSRAAQRGFNWEHPGSLLQSWTVRGRSDKVSELRHDGDLLVAVERAGGW